MIERYGASFPPGSQPGAMAAHCAPRPFVDIEDLQKTYEMSFHSSTKRDRTITPPPPQDIKLHPRLDEELRQDDGNLPSHRTRYHCAETGLISNFYHDNPTGQVARFYTVNNSNNHLPACGNSTQWGCRHMLAVVGGKDIGPPPQLDTRGEPVTGVEIEPTTEKNFERMISAEERERASIACTAAYEKLLRGLEMAKRNS
ncbi:hypothetical protein IFR05_003701 [Cadophora sp. M221]|nr:hypothetical protein IFR05_003701 [Cadophora sp. M221]